MFGTSLYERSPRWLQETLIASRSMARALLREGRAYRRVLRDIEGTQWLAREKLDGLVEEKLAQVLAVAFGSVPYYARYRDYARSDEPAVEVLRRLPCIDKGDVRRAGLEMVARPRRALLFKGSTSGTTGAPLTLYQDLASIVRENAFITRQLRWAGYMPGERRAWLRGDMIVPGSARNPPFWRLDRFGRMLMLSSFHLSEATAGHYLEALARFDPVLIQAFPSAIGFLAAYLRSKNAWYAGKALRSIVTSSETLSEEDRELIETRFGCKVFDWYGLFERVAAVGTCERGRYHLVSDYSYVELHPAGDSLYEIVGTSFNNLAMPLLRYRTGDYVEITGKEQCGCGRSFPVVTRVAGRDDDFVKLPDGSRVKRLSNAFKDVDGILESQIVQERLEEITVLVVPDATFGARSIERIRKNLHARLGDRIKVKVEPVESIPRSGSGKLRTIVCKV